MFILINLKSFDSCKLKANIANVAVFAVAPGVAISTYAKYCYRKLTKAALTGAKKVRALTSFSFSEK